MISNVVHSDPLANPHQRYGGPHQSGCLVAWCGKGLCVVRQYIIGTAAGVGTTLLLRSMRACGWSPARLQACSTPCMCTSGVVSEEGPKPYVLLQCMCSITQRHVEHHQSCKRGQHMRPGRRRCMAQSCMAYAKAVVGKHAYVGSEPRGFDRLFEPAAV